MPKIMDKNRQALVTLDTVSVCLVIAHAKLTFGQHLQTPVHACQLTSRHGELPNLVTNSTNDDYWKAIRKGVAPAFSPTNIR